MKLAVLSDVHADVHALTDALACIDRLGCDAIVCAGDLVDYGLFPDETLALLMSRKIPCIRGNHDRWAITQDADGGGWDLSNASRKFLATLPASWRIEHAGVRVAVHHASTAGDMDGLDPAALDAQLVRTQLDRADADILIVGHTHVAMDIELAGRGRIVNPGSVLRAPGYEPGDGPPTSGTFGILDVASGEFRVLSVSDGAPSAVVQYWRSSPS